MNSPGYHLSDIACESWEEEGEAFLLHLVYIINTPTNAHTPSNCGNVWRTIGGVLVRGVWGVLDMHFVCDAIVQCVCELCFITPKLLVTHNSSWFSTILAGVLETFSSLFKRILTFTHKKSKCYCLCTDVRMRTHSVVLSYGYFRQTRVPKFT